MKDHLALGYTASLLLDLVEVQKPCPLISLSLAEKAGKFQ